MFANYRYIRKTYNKYYVKYYHWIMNNKRNNAENKIG
jgi:hypothetical protein